MSIDAVEDPYGTDSVFKHLVASGAPGESSGVGSGQETPNISGGGGGKCQNEKTACNETCTNS